MTPIGSSSSIASLRLNGAALVCFVQFGLNAICGTLRLTAHLEAISSAPFGEHFRGAWAENLHQLEEMFERARKRGVVRKDLSSAAMAFYFNGVALSLMRGIAYFPELVRDFPVDKGVGPIVLRGIGAGH